MEVNSNFMPNLPDIKAIEAKVVREEKGDDYYRGYDADNNIIVQKQNSATLDENGNMIPCVASSYSLFEDGIQKGMYSDKDSDGNFDYLMFRDGNLTTNYFDYEDDGTYDDVKYNYLDENGRIAYSITDKGVDGVIDQKNIYEYDQNGKMTKESVDIANDGIIDIETTFDENGANTVYK